MCLHAVKRLDIVRHVSAVSGMARQLFTYQNNKRFEGVKPQLSDVLRVFTEVKLSIDHIGPAPNLKPESL